MEFISRSEKETFDFAFEIASKISENVPVIELEAMWNNELELMKGAA